MSHQPTSRALVTVTLDLEATPEPLVMAIDRLEEAIRLHFAPYVVVHKVNLTAQNTFGAKPSVDACPTCNGTGAEFPGHPLTLKCEDCNGTERKGG